MCSLYFSKGALSFQIDQIHSDTRTATNYDRICLHMDTTDPIRTGDGYKRRWTMSCIPVVINAPFLDWIRSRFELCCEMGIRMKVRFGKEDLAVYISWVTDRILVWVRIEYQRLVIQGRECKIFFVSLEQVGSSSLSICFWESFPGKWDNGTAISFSSSPPSLGPYGKDELVQCDCSEGKAPRRVQRRKEGPTSFSASGKKHATQNEIRPLFLYLLQIL